MRIEWLTTASSGRTHTCEGDDGQTGWKRHGVEVGNDTISYKVTFADLGRKGALCGLKPGTGWGSDLFIEDPCLRCVEKALKLGLEVDSHIMHLYGQNRHSKDDYKEWKKDPEAYNASKAVRS